MPIKKPFSTSLDPYDPHYSLYYTPYKEEITLADRWGDVQQTPLDIYRTDPKTGKPESLPHKYDIGHSRNVDTDARDDDYSRQHIDVNMLHALHDAMELNPNLKVTPEEMVTILAQEGREDFGANNLDPYNYAHNKQATNLYQNLLNAGYDERAAGLPALLLEKQMVAKRLNVPWQQAWNGMGTVSGMNRTGADYIKEVGMNAQNIGANKDAVKAVQQQMQEPKKWATAALRLKDINSSNWAKRQAAIQKLREEYVSGSNPKTEVDRAYLERQAQRVYPDAPVPLPDDPNAAVYEKASGGTIELPNDYRPGGRTRMI